MPKSPRFISRSILTILIILLLTQTVSAISLGVSPHSLRFDVGGPIDKNITIINNGNEVSSYEIYADSDYSSWVIISPSAFDLSPGMTREVTVRCIPPGDAAGNTTFRLNIAAKPAGTGLGIGAGVRIPVTVIAGEAKIYPGHLFPHHFLNISNYF